MISGQKPVYEETPCISYVNGKCEQPYHVFSFQVHMQSVASRVWAFRSQEHEGKQSVQRSGKCFVHGSHLMTLRASSSGYVLVKQCFTSFCSRLVRKTDRKKHFVQRDGKWGYQKTFLTFTENVWIFAHENLNRSSHVFMFPMFQKWFETFVNNHL